jgi:mRNA-degrading endonuclease toxin of MazEF toxin-antitoxin module
MTRSFGAGDTFLGGAEVHGKHHLWIIINHPARRGGLALFVNVTTLAEGMERTCVLQPGDHPFVKHASCIPFASAKSATVKQLELLDARGLIHRRSPVSPAVLAAIRAGGQVSPNLPAKYLALL